MSKRSVCIPMELMSRHTSLRIRGSVELFVCPAVGGDPTEALRIYRENRVSWRILRNGSNLLVSDKDCEGAVIPMEQLSGLGINGNLLRAGVGQFLGRAAHLALEHSLTGMELATEIPGSVGGILVMNAGVYGSEVRDILKSTRVITDEGCIFGLPAEDLELRHRISYIPSRGYTVLEAVYELRSGDRGVVEERMRELAAGRRGKQSLGYPNAGSTSERSQRYFAGKLIEDAGLRGYQVGGAQVSEKHCGFVISKGYATAGHVMEPCNYVRKTMREISGMELEMEVKRRDES